MTEGQPFATEEKPDMENFDVWNSEGINSEGMQNEEVFGAGHLDTSFHSATGRDGQPSTDYGIPVVVWWTPFTYRSYVVETCGLGQCIFTHDRGEIDKQQARAVLFYGPDVEWHDLPLPRKPDLYWGLLHDESPKNEWAFNHEDTISLFNFTSTFSRFSDFPLTTRFIASLSWLQSPPLSLEEKMQGEKASVAYVQSSCHSPSDRERYVKELMKYLRVDSLGTCLHNKDLPEHLTGTLKLDHPEFWQLMATYKFTLAFENAICPDYITEKFWRPLHLGSVPVYLGTETAREWAPSNRSVIFVSDFPSPKDLADYITYLDNNKVDYLKYLDFKRAGGITNEKLLEELDSRGYSSPSERTDFISAFQCSVCDHIYKRLVTEQSGMELFPHYANGSHYGCPKPNATLDNVPSNPEDSHLRYYHFEHEQSKSIGLAVQNMIAVGETNSSKFPVYLEQLKLR